MKKNKLKYKLKNNIQTYGSWITISSPIIPEIMSIAKFDWLCVDLEHSSININQAEDIIRIIELKNKVPLARLSSIDNIQIKRLLDSGARGLIIPMISNSKQIETIIQMMRYPPVGKRRRLPQIRPNQCPPPPPRFPGAQGGSLDGRGWIYAPGADWGAHYCQLTALTGPRGVLCVHLGVPV